MRLRLRKSIFSVWLLTNFLILILPVIISSIVLGASVRLVTNETRRANQAILTQLRDLIDSQLEDVRKSALEAAVNPGITAFIEVEDPAERIRSWDFFQKAEDLIGDLNYYSLSNSIVEDCFIYFGGSETVFTARGFEPVEDFYRTYYGYPTNGVESWLSELRGGTMSDFSELTLTDRGGNITTSLLYVVPLPGPDAGKEVLVVFVIDQEWISRTVRSLNNFRLEEVYILDRENRVWFSSSGETRYLESLDRLSAAPNGYEQFYTADGVRMAAIRTESSLTDWIYLSVGPYRYLAGNSEWLRFLAIGSICASVILGALLALFLTRRNYSPVEGLLALVSGERTPPTEKRGNEFDYIREAVEEQDRRRRRLEALVSRQKQSLERHYLARRLKGRAVPQENGGDEAGFLSPEPDDCFAVFIFHLHFDEAEGHGSEASLLPDLDGYFEIIESALEATIPESIRCELLEVDGMPAAVLRLSASAVSEPERLLLSSARETVNRIEEEFPATVTIAVSGLHAGAEELPDAYGEALNAMEYRYLNSTGNVISIDDIETPAHERPALGEEDERKLINLIRAGNGDEAEELFLRMAAEGGVDNDLPLYTRKFVLFELAFTVIRSVEIHENESASGEYEEEYFRTILKSETIDETVENIRRKIHSLCAMTRRRIEEGRERRIGDRVDRLIDARYSDKNLSLTLLADELSLNPRYLATLYKQETGDTILNRINARRLKEVKRLLAASGESLAQIAEECGFGNTHSLIRVFKKYEGLTPGRYKDLLQDSAE